MKISCTERVEGFGCTLRPGAEGPLESLKDTWSLKFARLARFNVLGGSWDLVSMVISTLIGVINIVTPITTLVTKSHDPLSTGFGALEP